MIRAGPPIARKEFVSAFKKKNKNTYVKGSKIYAKIKRKYREPEKLITDIIKTEYVKDKVKEYAKNV